MKLKEGGASRNNPRVEELCGEKFEICTAEGGGRTSRSHKAAWMMIRLKIAELMVLLSL